MSEQIIAIAITGTFIILSALVTIFGNWLVSKSQSRASIERLERELAEARQREQRQRRRDVRSEPLLNFRRELARMAVKYRRVIEAEQMQHTRFGPTEDEAREVLRDAANDYNAYVRSGDFGQAFLQLSDEEVVDGAKRIFKRLGEAYVETKSVKLVSTELAEIDAEVTALQEMINQRLE